MQIGGDIWLTREKVFQKPLITKIVGFEERELQSKDKKKSFKNTVVITEDGKINAWDCYKADIEIGQTVNIECSSATDKMTISVML